MTTTKTTIGLIWDTETGILEDTDGYQEQLADLINDVEDGSLRQIIEWWTGGELEGEALADYEALCDAVKATVTA